MPALELLTGFVTAPGATLTALTMASGNSLTIRNNNNQGVIALIDAWADNQAAGILRIKSPRLHDNVQNIRLSIVASDVFPRLPKYMQQLLVSQDTLDVSLSGSGTAGDIETASLLIYYQDLPGVSARLIDSDELSRRMVNIMTVENTLALGTTGGYSGQEAINAEYDLMKANTDYALIGYLVSAECASIRWQGSDTGNLGVGGPGNPEYPEITRSWFTDLSLRTGIPMIPVFNSANKAGILIDAAQDENGTDVTVQSIFAQLADA